MAPFLNAEAASGPDGALPSSVARNNAAHKKPSLPPSFFKFPVRTRLKIIQQYISSFEYRQSPQTSYNSHKFRPLARIMDTAKMMVYNPQPIKCVEAVFLALYLTAGIADAERIPLGFSSEFHGQVHQHLVLIVRYTNKYGAFGISRQKNLMSKEFGFESLSSIVGDFKKAYEQLDHKVTRIRVGLPVEHNIESFNFVCWRYLSLDLTSTSWQQCTTSLEKHMNNARRLWKREALTLSKQCFRCQTSCNGQRSGRRVSEACVSEAYKKQTAMKSLAVHSLELLPVPINIKVTDLQKEHQTKKRPLYQDRKALKRAKENIRKCDLRLPMDSVSSIQIVRKQDGG